MAIRIDDGAIVRMLTAQIKAQMDSGYTLRFFADPINDAENNPLVCVTRMELHDVPRSQPQGDQHEADLDLTIVGSIDSDQPSSYAIGTVGATIAAALSEANLEDGVALGGSDSEHLVTLGLCVRTYEAVSIEDRQIMTVTCSFPGSKVKRQSGSAIASFLT